jgi:hypothetical protein
MKNFNNFLLIKLSIEFFLFSGEPKEFFCLDMEEKVAEHN